MKKNCITFITIIVGIIMLFNIFLIRKNINLKNNYLPKIENYINTISLLEEKNEIYNRLIFNNISLENERYFEEGDIHLYGRRKLYQNNYEISDTIFLYIPEGTCSICISEILLKPVVNYKRDFILIIITDDSEPRSIFVKAKEIGLNFLLYKTNIRIYGYNNSLRPFFFKRNKRGYSEYVFSPYLKDPIQSKKYFELLKNK